MTGTSRLLIGMLLALTGTAHAFDISAKSGIIIDADSGKVLWEKDCHTPRYPASTTKIMTALLLLEHCLPSDIITAPPGIEKIQESSFHLKQGEKVTVETMMYALMLRSANDGCVAVADHVSGSVAAFAKLMNERAKQIGCTDTHFNNPNGLNDPKHKTSAYDLALMAREAMKYELFRNVVHTQKIAVKRSINQKDLFLENHNKWLAKDMTADGIKTGYTKDAGKCYVGSATRDGYRLITVVLNSTDWQTDHQNMLNWAFQNHERTLFAARGSEVMKVPVAEGEASEVPVMVDADVYHIYRKDLHPNVVANLAVSQTITAPVQQGQSVGSVVFTDGTGWKVEFPAYLGQSVPARARLMGTLGGPTGFGILGLAAVAGAFSWRRRSRRARSYAEAARSSSY